MKLPTTTVNLLSIFNCAATSLPETINTGGPIAFLCVASETKPDGKGTLRLSNFFLPVGTESLTMWALCDVSLHKYDMRTYSIQISSVKLEDSTS